MYEIQSSAAIGVVALTVIIFIWRLSHKKKSGGGCSGGCGSNCSLKPPIPKQHDFRINRD